MTALVSSSGSVILDGSVTVRTIEVIHARLVEALRRHGTVIVDCTGLTEADISLAQLLIAAQRSARASGNTVVVVGFEAGVLHAVLDRGGLGTAQLAGAALGGPSKDVHP
jgi:ABC-type transporter Mla MlaB component